MLHNTGKEPRTKQDTKTGMGPEEQWPDYKDVYSVSITNWLLDSLDLRVPFGNFSSEMIQFRI